MEDDNNKPFKKENFEKESVEKKYLKLIEQSSLADFSGVQGCMILKPYGYKIWDIIRSQLDLKLSELGFENVYFPMFITRESLAREKTHHDSFIRECVHCDSAGEKKIDLFVRPTSEAIIYPSIRNWIKTKSDLPLKINQWCSIVRWEILKPNFPLIRDNEFLWHEAHSCHSTKEECEKMVSDLHEMYRCFIEDVLAIPLFHGKKPERRKFAGADYTIAHEAMMNDCRSVQIATSHSLGQNFSRAFDISFSDADGNKSLVWQACAGFTTRLIGALVMVHSDNKGLVLPPNIAPYQVAISDDDVLFEKIKTHFRVVKMKKDEAIIKGVPLIIEAGRIIIRLGLEEQKLKKNKIKQINDLLEKTQANIFMKANNFKLSHTIKTKNFEEFKKYISKRKGFCYVYWCGECSRKIKESTNGSVRLINELDTFDEKCIQCSNEAKYVALIGQSY